MNNEIDYDLTLNQWEALISLRPSALQHPTLNRLAVESLVDLQLATVADGRPSITATGRIVLLRGSPRLWDVAA